MEIGKMRRRDRQIQQEAEIEEVLKAGKVLTLAMSIGDMPYAIPMLYAYEDRTLYFHCAEVGQKLDILRENPKVCFVLSRSAAEDVVVNSEKPCDWGWGYESVVGFGKAEICDDRETKIKAYNLLVEKLQPPGYAHSEDLYTEKKIKGTFIIKVVIDQMTGKRWDGHKPQAHMQQG